MANFSLKQITNNNFQFSLILFRLDSYRLRILCKILNLQKAADKFFSVLWFQGIFSAIILFSFLCSAFSQHKV